MDQLIRKKDKDLVILEVPFPVLEAGQVLVRNHFSVICPGTEGVETITSGPQDDEKIQARKREVKQVIAEIKKSGLADAFRLVMNRVEAYSPLGFSCSGEVIAVSPEITDIKVGDRVACGGDGARHADVVAVPRHLCARIPREVDPKHAAFTTVAAVAIQGVRQADVRFGERVAVIGLGLIGQLTIQILQAAGVECVGIDINDFQVKFALDNGIDLAFSRNEEGLEHRVATFTRGHGVDAVIICAGSTTTDPVNLAGVLCRKKGKVVVIGRVPTGFEREHYFRKELDLRMSASYGPGRFDPIYEDRGVDYPIGYVRWTENRNMAAFIDLLRRDKIRMDRLISHTIKLEEAPEAFRKIRRRTEPFLGVIIDYDGSKEATKRVDLVDKQSHPVQANVGLIGVGDFARDTLLPLLKGKCNFIGVSAVQGQDSRFAADRYGFGYCTDKADEIITDKKINTLFINSSHHLHAPYVIKALTLGKHVFVTTPLALDREGLRRIWETHRVLSTTQTAMPVIMTGFNRRFSPHVIKIKEMFADFEPRAIQYRIIRDRLPEDHWLHDPKKGGGRVVAEVCQFIDLVIFLSGGKLASMSAKSLRDEHNLDDTLVICLAFENGSVATINYFSNGSARLPKEHLEVFCSGQTVVLDDFKKMRILGRKKWSSFRPGRRDPGHKAELAAFLEAVEHGLPSPIPFEELYESSLATFAVAESIKR